MDAREPTRPARKILTALAGLFALGALAGTVRLLSDGQDAAVPSTGVAAMPAVPAAPGDLATAELEPVTTPTEAPAAMVGLADGAEREVDLAGAEPRAASRAERGTERMVRGRLVDGRGAPARLPGVAVRLADGPRQVFALERTDAEGRFALDLPRGRTAELEVFDRSWRAVHRVASDGARVVELDVELALWGSIVARVDEQPLPFRATLLFLPPDAPVPRRLSDAERDAELPVREDGRFFVLEARAREAVLVTPVQHVRAHLLLPSVTPVHMPGEAECRIVLEPGLALDVRLVEGGPPRPCAPWVGLEIVAPRLADGSLPTVHSSDGRETCTFHVAPLPPGPVTLRVLGAGPAAEPELVDVRAEDGAVELRLAGIGRAALRGVVTRADLGPVAGTRVGLWPLAVPAATAARPLERGPDPRGRFEAEDLAPGRWRLVASHPDGWFAAAEVELARDETTAVELELGPGAVLALAHAGVARDFRVLAGGEVVAQGRVGGAWSPRLGVPAGALVVEVRDGERGLERVVERRELRLAAGEERRVEFGSEDR